MKAPSKLQHRQRGAALIVGLIMLVLITVMITSSFSMSASNVKAVGNAQFRGEAVAAANQAIEQVLSSPFSNSPAAEEVQVDINSDGGVDYIVQFAAPSCIGASPLPSSALPPSSSSLGSAFSAAPPNYETVWDLNATVTDANNSGAMVVVHQGVRLILTQAQYTTVCT
jgi:Tfp pilus assembly protein PilV